MPCHVLFVCTCPLCVFLHVFMCPAVHVYMYVSSCDVQPTLFQGCSPLHISIALNSLSTNCVSLCLIFRPFLPPLSICQSVNLLQPRQTRQFSSHKTNWLLLLYTTCSINTFFVLHVNTYSPSPLLSLSTSMWWSTEPLCFYVSTQRVPPLSWQGEHGLRSLVSSHQLWCWLGWKRLALRVHVLVYVV